MKHTFLFKSSSGWAASMLLDDESGELITNLMPPSTDPNLLPKDELDATLSEVAVWVIETRIKCGELCCEQ